ncbi:MAG: hypothetical protein RL095_3536 [Verrucomicrobiota bacterium]|jgi:oligoribonuclease
MSAEIGNLVWIDLEMTGLDPRRDSILEIACLITNKDLEIIAEGPDLVIHASDETLAAMNAWCRENHGRSGLTQACRDSKISLADAEAQVLEFIQQYALPGKSPLCGNSIGMDRMFLFHYMPKLLEHLHYRVIDVSSFKEVSWRWYGEMVPKFSKKTKHRALDDIRESVAEMCHYRRHMCRPQVTQEDGNGS